MGRWRKEVHRSRIPSIFGPIFHSSSSLYWLDSSLVSGQYTGTGKWLCALLWQLVPLLPPNLISTSTAATNVEWIHTATERCTLGIAIADSGTCQKEAQGTGSRSGRGWRYRQPRRWRGGGGGWWGRWWGGRARAQAQATAGAEMVQAGRRFGEWNIHPWAEPITCISRSVQVWRNSTRLMYRKSYLY